MINELCDLHGITYLLTIEALSNASAISGGAYRIVEPTQRQGYPVCRILYPKSLPPKAHATYGFHYKHRHILLAHVCSNELISILILATN